MKRLLVVIALLAALPSVVARAGDRALEIAVIDVSAPGTEGSSACMAALTGAVREDETHLHPMTRARWLAAIGRSESADFMTWDTDVFAAAPDLPEAIVLVDCRPTEHRADVLVRSAGGALGRLQLREVPIDEARARWLGQAALVHAWNGFVP